MNSFTYERFIDPSHAEHVVPTIAIFSILYLFGASTGRISAIAGDRIVNSLLTIANKVKGRHKHVLLAFLKHSQRETY